MLDMAQASTGLTVQPSTAQPSITEHGMAWLSWTAEPVLSPAWLGTACHAMGWPGKGQAQLSMKKLSTA